MSKIITINSASNENDFDKIFANVAHNHKLETESISSKDCAIAVGYGNGRQPVAIIHKDNDLIHDETAFFIKSYKGDSYMTYLLGHILKRSGKLFTDEANLAHSNSADKMTMTVLLPFSNISVPRSILCTARSYEANQAWIDRHVNYPCVVKKSGSRGKQVWKINDAKELVTKINLDSQLTLIQEYIENNHDFRVFVVDSEVLAVIKRTSADGFYNNVSQGGKALPGKLSQIEIEMCKTAAKVADLRIAGVDLVRGEKHAYIFEVNKNPQMNLFNEAAGFDIERAISQKIVDTLL